MPRLLGVNLPSTLQRSSKAAQRTFAKTMKSAEEQYGRGARAGRTAYAALKKHFEKIGDHWERKKNAGPSDPRSRQPGPAKRRQVGETYGGVDVEGHTRDELRERADSMGADADADATKAELGRAINRKQKQMTRRARTRKKER